MFSEINIAGFQLPSEQIHMAVFLKTTNTIIHFCLHFDGHILESR